MELEDDDEHKNDQYSFMEDDPDTVDLRSNGLEKLARASSDYVLSATTLLLDDNHLQRLDYLHTYQCLEKLSVQNNHLTRIFQVAKLNHLKILNLANNSIVAMEGLKELKLLSWLSLASNCIKTIENLNQNIHLEHLDLSGNNIPHISDLSYLRNLKTLLLHGNRIGTLRLCDHHLPSGLSTLTLNDNQLMDLTDACHLTHLSVLEQLTIANNPCIVQPEDLRKQFDYRPFIINWCLGLRILDGIPVGAKESLKAEWLYSQSKGRHFGVGQHSELKEFLVSVCPLHPDENWEEDKKLNLILSKVQEHQQSLRLDSASSTSVPGTPRSNTLPRSSTLESPRSLSGRRNSESMRKSVHPESPFKRQGSLGRSNVRRYPCASPSPIRRTPGGGSPRIELGSYALALPRQLYSNDVNGGIDMMTQSMISTSHNSSNSGNNNNNNNNNIDKERTCISSNSKDLMTTSLDPSMLTGVINNFNNDARSQQPLQHEQQSQQSSHVPEAWINSEDENNKAGPSRPNVLFSSERKELKDLCLQDLSDNEQSHSMNYSRLQSKLNPVPESLNSPDIPAPTSSRPSRDDPLLGYETRDNLHQKGSTPKKQHQKHHQNGYSSSNSEDAISTVIATSSKPLSTSVSGKLSSSNTPIKKVNYKRTNSDNIPSKIDTGLSRKIRSASTGRVKAVNKTILEFKKTEGVGRKRPPPPLPPHSMDEEEDAQDEESESENEKRKNKSQRPTRNTQKLNDENSGRKKSTTTSQTIRGGGGSLDRTDKYSMRQRNNEKNVVKNEKNRSLMSSPSPKSGYTRGSTQMNRSATIVQKMWKGHATRNKDEKVKELKDEIRALRGEEHIRFLTKELQSTKQALEQERKLRALQMDAIKVLWKEVQMMDATKGQDKPRPSGSNGSKISSRASEHSIAKLMETLEATAGSNPNFSNNESNSKESNRDESDAVRSLNMTCSNLQSQVEQLQGSLSGVMKFMSAFTNMDPTCRTRHSSSASQETVSFNYYQPQQLEQQSLPVMVNSVILPNKTSAANNVSMSKSCHCLTQTDLSAMGKGQEIFRRVVDNSLESNSDSDLPTSELPLLQRMSPRPRTLSLNKESKDRIPGLAHLASSVLLNSPQAPAQVKAFARTLVEGLISDAVNSLELSGRLTDEAVTDISLSLNETEIQSCIDTPTPTTGVEEHSEEHSSHIETDSLEERMSPK